MVLHPLAQRFASVAGAYERGRPEYPRAMVGALAAELEVSAGATVLDLAAGGKLSRTLLAAGLNVVAVEPLRSLREVLADTIGAERVREGVAESIPLADGSVDAVTVADAFQWFSCRVRAGREPPGAAPRWRSGGALDGSGLVRSDLGARTGDAGREPAPSAPSLRRIPVAGSRARGRRMDRSAGDPGDQRSARPGCADP